MTKYLCPHCKKMKPATHFACEMSSKGGSAKTDAKAEAARANGAKGGRPKSTIGKVLDAQFAKKKPTRKKI